jgi:hypothetical protein
VTRVDVMVSFVAVTLSPPPKANTSPPADVPTIRSPANFEPETAAVSMLASTPPPVATADWVPTTSFAVTMFPLTVEPVIERSSLAADMDTPPPLATTPWGPIPSTRFPSMCEFVTVSAASCTATPPPVGCDKSPKEYAVARLDEMVEFTSVTGPSA